LTLNRAHHFVTPTDEDGHGACVGTLLNDHHLVPRRSKSDFPDDSRLPQLLWCQILKPRNDATLGSNGNQLTITVSKRQCLRKVIIEGLPRFLGHRPIGQPEDRFALIGGSLHRQSPTGK
jgi:hypothetical protein